MIFFPKITKYIFKNLATVNCNFLKILIDFKNDFTDKILYQVTLKRQGYVKWSFKLNMSKYVNI